MAKISEIEVNGHYSFLWLSKKKHFFFYCAKNINSVAAPVHRSGPESCFKGNLSTITL